MSRSDERELFLKYLSYVYLNNPKFPICYDTIYHQLSKFVVRDGKQCLVGDDSLLSVQLGLNNIFRYNDKVNTFTYGCFWVIENRMGKNDTDFYNGISNAIKLYVAIDPSCIYKVSELLFKFMIKEGIVMQCKIPKEMRNDALVCRVSTKEDAKKVSDYLNSLNYKTNVRPNPFLFDNGKISVAMDGNLSYNSTLSKLICEYLRFMRKSNSLDKVNSLDFSNFVKKQISLLKGQNKLYFMNLYEIKDEDRFKDFIMISNIICKNIDSNLSLDELFKYQGVKNVDSKRIYSKQEEDKILHVINNLNNYYSVDDIHKIIIQFIESGNYRLFTRKNNIRSIVMDNFAPEDVKNIISDLGWKAFLSASKVTYDKYGSEWLYSAIDKYLNNMGISGFTRDDGVRSRLGLVIPPLLLREKIMNIMFEKGIELNTENLTNLVLEETTMKKNNRTNGRM